MTEGSYVVIRFVADPARNEPINVGVLAWQGPMHELTFDREAVERVVRQNPRLHPDALAGLEDVVRTHLGLEDRPPGEELRERLMGEKLGLLQWSEPRRTTLDEPNQAALHATVDRLIDRIVAPRTRTAGRSREDLLAIFERQVRPMVRAGRVYENHLFQNTRSGVARNVRFFANSGNNAALDQIRLDYRKSRDVRLHADAEANKAHDILNANDVRMIVLTTFSTDYDMLPTNDEARSILEAADVTVVESVADAVREMGLEER